MRPHGGPSGHRGTFGHTRTVAQSRSPTAAPPRRQELGRIVGLDVARALALFGMMATHLLPESIDGRHVAWWQQLAGGRAAALFALLAGASLALITDRGMAAALADGDAGVRDPAAAGGDDRDERGAAGARARPDDRDDARRRIAVKAARAGIAVRAAVIGFLGLLLGQMDTGIAVILTYYAVLFLLGLPFLVLRARTLLWLAAGWAVVAPLLSHLVRPYMPVRLGASPSLDFLLVAPVRLVEELLFTGYYPAVPWLAYLLAGLAIGRLPLHRVRTAIWLAVVGAVLAFTAWGASWLVLHRLGGLAHLRASAPGTSPFDAMSVDQALVRGTFGTTPTTSWWWLTVAAPHSSTTLDLFQTIGSALLVIGLCLLASHGAPRALAVVFAAGTMTLTLYSLHLWLLAVGVGPPRETAALFWLHVSAALVFAMVWRATIGRGPLEAFTTSCSQLGRNTVLLDMPPR
jgi:hypothetical protein